MVNVKPEINDPCPCGSGKIFDNCCSEWYETAAAKSSMKKVVPAVPTTSECNRLVALYNARHLAELETLARLLLERYPDSGLIWNLFGASLQMQNKDGLFALKNATKFLPNDADAHSNLGNALSDLGRLEEAEASYLRALQINPHNANVHSNLGATLNELCRPHEAETCYRRALQIMPNLAQIHYNLGNTLSDLGRLDEAEVCYRRALKIQPDFVKAQSNILFTCNLLSNKPPEQMLAEARNYGELVARQARPHKVWGNAPEPDRCLRVGLVSGDLHQHPVSNFLESVLAALGEHASGRLTFFAYYTHSKTDAVTDRIKAYCHGWNSAVGVSDETLARRIRDDQIDILIDLSGHTSRSRLPVFAWKPAPVQVAWLGYLATTGVAAIDYLIADAWTLPKTEEPYFTEKIWRLPETYLCFTAPSVRLEVTPLPALTNGYITFGCFNHMAKVNDAVMALWGRVLGSVSGSRLFLKSPQFSEAAVRQRVVERFAAHGIGADRLILKSLVPRAEYLVPYQQVDIALDPFPYPGITTSIEGLWMGVPMLTLSGERFLSRQGIGLLMNAGLPDWVATDTDDYVARAVSHAGDLQRLAALRNGLRQQVLASPIFDAPRFAHHFEAALRDMWRKWCAQQQGMTLF